MFALQRSEVDMQGVIFLHDIAETRFGGSQRKTLELLKALVGDQAMRNVIIGTTMWSPENTSKYNNEVRRERDFLSKHWRGIYKTVRVHDEDKNTALQIINDLLARSPSLLLVQEEILRPPHTCEETTAGKIAIPEGRREAEEAKRAFEEKMQKMQEENAAREEEYRRQQEETMRAFEEERARNREEVRRREEEWRVREEENLRIHQEQMRNMGEQNQQALQELENRRQEEARQQKEEAARMWNELREQQANDMKQQQEDYARHFAEECQRRDDEAKQMREAERIRNEQLMEELRVARQPPVVKRGFWDHIGNAFGKCVIQ